MQRKMFCKKCGSELPENVKFCPKCGAATGQSPATGQSSRPSPDPGRGGRLSLSSPKVRVAGGAIAVLLLAVGSGIGLNRVSQPESQATGAKADGAVETWDGARADLAEGRRPKEAVYHFGDQESSITYDMDGNITGVAGEISREAFTRVLDADRSLYDYFLNSNGEMEKGYYHYSPEDYNVQTRQMVTKDAKYFFAVSGALQQFQSNSHASKLSSHDYRYDSKGRLAQEKAEGVDKDGGPLVYTKTYNYEKDFLVSSWSSETKHSSGFAPTIYDHTYEREYDALGNIIWLRYYEDLAHQEDALRWIKEWEYDEGGKLLSSKYTEGHRADSDSEVYYESYDITQYNASGDILETNTLIGINGKEYTVKKTEYLYDESGRITEENTYELLAGNGWLDEKADWCNGGGNTEMYITQKIEYQYDDKGTGMCREIQYQYEANKDYSKVNLTATNEGGWKESQKNGTGYWTITYYTEEEIEQYLHDQEFSPVN